VAQGVGPEFKHQYCKEKRKRKKEKETHTYKKCNSKKQAALCFVG
jgi:hypothetical protein